MLARQSADSALADVVTIEKSGEHFRLLYDVKGRFTIHRISPEEATYKLLKVRKVALGSKGVPYIVTHDGRTIRYPDPAIAVNDVVKFDLEQNKITDFVKFETGNIVMITGGRNMGRAGVIVHREKHIGGFDIVHAKDTLDRTFATRYDVFTCTSVSDVHVSVSVSRTCSSSARASSLGSPCPRARVPSSPSPRSATSAGDSARPRHRLPRVDVRGGGSHVFWPMTMLYAYSLMLLAKRMVVFHGIEHVHGQDGARFELIQ
jgi:hypothetical protein